MKEIKNKILENLSYLTKSYDMQNPTKDIITVLINKSFNTLPNDMQTKLLSIGQDINTSLEKLRVSFKKYKCWIIIIHATNYFLFNRLNMIMKMCKKIKKDDDKFKLGSYIAQSCILHFECITFKI